MRLGFAPGHFGGGDAGVLLSVLRFGDPAVVVRARDLAQIAH